MGQRDPYGSALMPPLAAPIPLGTPCVPKFTKISPFPSAIPSKPYCYLFRPDPVRLAPLLALYVSLLDRFLDRIGKEVGYGMIATNPAPRVQPEINKLLRAILRRLCFSRAEFALHHAESPARPSLRRIRSLSAAYSAPRRRKAHRVIPRIVQNLP